MTLPLALSVIQLALAIILIAAILLQQRGTGLGAAFGGEGNVFAARRGVERALFTVTIIAAILFFATALAQNIL